MVGLTTSEGRETMMFNAKTRKEQDQVLGRLNAETQLRHVMRIASERMEMFDLFDQVESFGEDYRKGFQDGFYASKILHQKYKTW